MAGDRWLTVTRVECTSMSDASESTVDSDKIGPGRSAGAKPLLTFRIYVQHTPEGGLPVEVDCASKVNIALLGQTGRSRPALRILCFNAI